MPDENLTPEEEALIQKLVDQYQAQLRQALKKKPRTLQQIEDTAEQVGNQVKRDLEEAVVRREGTGDSGKQTACACGNLARYVADYSKRWVTRHSVLHLERAYYYCPLCRKGFCPLDARLGIGCGEYSPAVVALSARFGGYLPPRAAVRELAEVCGIGLAANTLAQHARAVGVALKREWQREEEAFFACPDKAVTARPPQMQMTLDGVMLHVDGAWHEVKLGCAYTRSVRGGVASARYTATLANAATFGQRFRVLGHLCGADNCRAVGIVADGSEWIWQEVGKYYPCRVQILDYYHATQHLWEVAVAQYGEGTTQAAAWMDQQQTRLLSDQVGAVLKEVGAWEAATQAHRDVQRRVSNYLCTHASRMQYKRFEAQGYHIGSGVAEAGNKAVVQARMKGAGMRWKRVGAEAMLHLRCAVCSTERPDFRKMACQALAA